MPKAPAYIYEKLTWPEVNLAIAAGKVAVIPVGAIEQHGPHLPLDVDCVLPHGVALRAAELVPDKVVVLPTIPLGYTGHVMDFPGTLNLHYQHFIDMIVDLGASLAYHGFKKLILLNGHGSNLPPLNLAARRINLETDAECVFTAWWQMLTVDKAFLPTWRESAFPGGCAHACELETSAYLYLDRDNVREDLIKDGSVSYNREKSAFHWVDLFGSGSAPLLTYTSSFSQVGVHGQPSLATVEKGRRAIEEAARQLARLIEDFQGRPKAPRIDHHAVPPSMEMPWNQHRPDRSRRLEADSALSALGIPIG